MIHGAEVAILEQGLPFSSVIAQLAQDETLGARREGWDDRVYWLQTPPKGARKPFMFLKTAWNRGPWTPYAADFTTSDWVIFHRPEG